MVLIAISHLQQTNYLGPGNQNKCVRPTHRDVGRARNSGSGPVLARSTSSDYSKYKCISTEVSM